ncbi:transporter [Vibrio phage vB_ValS_PJ32]|nr:transporter [Vibrio phage vB_ValS_PJ32]
MAQIKSTISDAAILKELGLLGDFQIIDVAAQQEGYAAGDAILTEPNAALGSESYSYFVQLVGQQLEVQIPKAHFDEFEETTLTIGHAIDRASEVFFNRVYDEISNFFVKVKHLLVAKPVSPTLALLKAQKEGVTDLDGGEGTKKVNVANILHYNELLNANPDQKPVQLAEAEFLYQPVHGTKSLYNIICLTTTGIKMAASYKDNTLKLRLLNTWYNATNEDYLNDLCKEWGFVKKSGGHYSVAFLDLEKKDVQRTLWALLSTFEPNHIRTGLPLLEEFI